MLNIYNTNFQVKYHDIEEELLLKKTNGTILENNEENNYTIDDIFTICDKLYRDELTSVFYADSILDDKIDEGITKVLEKMLEYRDFAIAFEKIEYFYKEHLLNQNDDSNVEQDKKDYLYSNSKDIVSLILFSQPVFYLTHKCICEQLVYGFIDHELLYEFRDLIINHIQKTVTILNDKIIDNIE